MTTEVRFVADLSDADLKGRQLRFVASVLETPYDVYAQSGIFAETLAERVFETTLSRHSRNIPLLINHDKKTPGIGRASDWENDGKRLIATYVLGESDEAVKTAQLIADGAFGGVSASFIPKKSQWSKDRSHVRRDEARLVEMSLATIPTNADHEILELRSFVTVAANPPEIVSTPRIDAVRARIHLL